MSGEHSSPALGHGTGSWPPCTTGSVRGSASAKEERELTAAFAGAGLGLMLAGGLLFMMWFGRLP